MFDFGEQIVAPGPSPHRKGTVKREARSSRPATVRSARRPALRREADRVRSTRDSGFNVKDPPPTHGGCFLRAMSASISRWAEGFSPLDKQPSPKADDPGDNSGRDGRCQGGGECLREHTDHPGRRPLARMVGANCFP